MLATAFPVAGALAVEGTEFPVPEHARSSAPGQTADAGSLVRRGGWAILSTEQGGVAIESRVEVLQDGKAGQRVLVRGAAWPHPIAARVVGPAAVEPTR